MKAQARDHVRRPRLLFELQRHQLRSPRWGQGLRGGQLPELKNPEMSPASRLRSILFWVVLAAITFGSLVVGYGTSFWQR